MDVPLPPGTTKKTFELIPARHREDAIQEAWLAYLQGKRPKRAAEKYAINELRRERRHIQVDTTDDDNIDDLEPRIKRKF